MEYQSLLNSTSSKLNSNKLVLKDLTNIPVYVNSSHNFDEMTIGDKLSFNSGALNVNNDLTLNTLTISDSIIPSANADVQSVGTSAMRFGNGFYANMDVNGNTVLNGLTTQNDIVPNADNIRNIGHPSARFKDGNFVNLNGDLITCLDGVFDTTAINTANIIDLNVSNPVFSGNLDVRNVYPQLDNTYELGSVAKKFARVRATDLHGIIQTPSQIVIGGVGTLTQGTWNANPIAIGYGGTGITSVASGNILYSSALNTLTPTAINASGRNLINTIILSDQIPYGSATGVYSTTSCPAFGRTLISSVDATTARTNLVLGSASVMTGPSSAIVGLTDVQTLTNKTLTDTTNNITARGLRSATTTVAVSSATAPTTGQVLTATSSTNATWQTPTVISGTTNRITVTSGVVNISPTYAGQASITTLGVLPNLTVSGTIYGGNGIVITGPASVGELSSGAVVCGNIDSANHFPTTTNFSLLGSSSKRWASSCINTMNGDIIEPLISNVLTLGKNATSIDVNLGNSSSTGSNMIMQASAGAKCVLSMGDATQMFKIEYDNATDILKKRVAGTKQYLYVDANAKMCFGDSTPEPGYTMRITHSDNEPCLKMYRPTAVTTNVLFGANSNVGGTDLTKMRVMADGKLENTTGIYGTISDASLKENIVPYNSDCIESIEFLGDNMVKYNLIGDDLTQIGWIAQTIQENQPGCVYEGDDGKLGLKTSLFYMKNIKATSVLIKEVRQLQNDVNGIKTFLGL